MMDADNYCGECGKDVAECVCASAVYAGYLHDVEDVPPGCMEIPGYIIPVHSMDTPAWLKQDGAVTRVWAERGVWPTAAAARESIGEFCR